MRRSFERGAGPQCGRGHGSCESSIAWLKSILPSARWQTPPRCSINCGPGRPRRRSPACGWRTAWPAWGSSGSGRRSGGDKRGRTGRRVYAECLGKGVRLPGVRHVNVYPQIASGPTSTAPGGRGYDRPPGGCAAARSRCWNWASAWTGFGPT